MKAYNQKVESVTERLMSAMFSFWSAMLTAHTVILSVSVALITTNPAAAAITQFKALGLVASVSMLLLLLNFAATRKQYEEIGQRLINYDSDLTEAERTHDIKTAKIRYVFMHIVETSSVIGLAIETGLLTWVLLL